jgi:pimeloyl-ACP methyl ester carboxylesterase
VNQDGETGGAPFTERFVQVDESRIRYLEAGQGNTVIVLPGSDGAMPSALMNQLAQRFRVVAFELHGAVWSLPTHELARTVARAAAATHTDHYVLLSSRGSAPVALWQAIEEPQRIEAVVLIAPDGVFSQAAGGINDPELERRLKEIQAPTLALFGTNDAIVTLETGRIYAERIPNCYFVLVYDAGQAIETDRPEALLTAVRDFLERRENFVVNRTSTVINR